MLSDRFIKPKYDSYCFSNIPGTIKYLLTGDGSSALPVDVLGNLPHKYDTVVLFLIDAFGWSCFEKYADDFAFLQRFQADGTVTKLTSQFPSTTASQVTTIHTGLPVGQNGVFEWHYYEPRLDAIISPLLFSLAGTQKRERLRFKEVTPEEVFPNQTFYQELGQRGIRSHVFQNRVYTPSSFGNVVFQGAEVHAYRSFPEMLINVGELLGQIRSPSYVFVYFDRIDDIGHQYGPDSAQIAAEIDIFLTSMERLLFNKGLSKNHKTLLMVTADHGLAQIDPKTTVYLNLDPRFTGFKQFIRKNQTHELLIPAGSCRDMFLYIKKEKLEAAKDFLNERLTGVADVCRVDDLIKEGLFGPEPMSEEFLGRVGNLVILPYENQSVWWYEQGKFEQNFYGHHGGLSKAEMEIPLLMVPW